MLGSIIGDILGLTYKFENAGEYDFEAFPEGTDFTDNTFLTIAVADAILNNKPYAATIKEYAINWPPRGYCSMFSKWYHNEISQPYNSFGTVRLMPENL